MYEKRNMLSCADKDLICEFLYCSMGRVLQKAVTAWGKPVPQGVSVYMLHSDGRFEYLFTKDDKYNVARDKPDEVQELLDRYVNPEKPGLVFYLNSCMVPIASKHKQFSY